MPSHMTIDNFMKDYLVDCIDDILAEINSYIFGMENVDLSHIYIDGAKIAANVSKIHIIKSSFQKSLFPYTTISAVNQGNKSN